MLPITRALGWLSNLWNESRPYLSTVLLGAATSLALMKDWRDYGKMSKKFGKYVPLGLAAITVFISVLGLEDIHQARVESQSDKQQAQLAQGQNHQIITDLTSQVRDLRDDNKAATDSFTKSFSTLYGKFGDLQSKVQNGDLLKELKDTREEVAAAQSKLTQPKAVVLATFPATLSTQIPTTEVLLSPTGDIVTVSFEIYNSSDVTAVNGVISVRVCITCTFAEETPGFIKVAGADENDRNHDFQRIFARSASEVFSIRVRPPKLKRVRFGISFFIACETCTAPVRQELWINEP